jgi:hypothetical protein
MGFAYCLVVLHFHRRFASNCRQFGFLLTVLSSVRGRTSRKQNRHEVLSEEEVRNSLHDTHWAHGKDHRQKGPRDLRLRKSTANVHRHRGHGGATKHTRSHHASDEAHERDAGKRKKSRLSKVLARL